MTQHYPFGLFAGSVAMGLTDGPEQPIALFADESIATAIARRFYGPCAYVERVSYEHCVTLTETQGKTIHD